jgi:ABC-2 type transport system ATP-binding protein
MSAKREPGFVIYFRKTARLPCHPHTISFVLGPSLDGLRSPRVQTLSMSESLNGEAPSISMAVETSALVRRFGDFVAVDNLNLSVQRGSFFGFLGPNGAGKSTTIKMLTGLLAPTSGRIRVLGRDLSTEPLEVKRRIGVVPEDLNLFERLTGAEMLSFTGRMYGLQKAEIAERSPELLDLMELTSDPKKLIVEYSHGMKKKLSLACALIHRPEILFLDEPFEGVDAIASRTLKDLLSRLTARGLTVFLTSHVLEIVERLCSDIAIISQGKLLASGSLNELRKGIQVDGDGEHTGPISLEEYFIHIVGGERSTGEEEVLQWLT